MKTLIASFLALATLTVSVPASVVINEILVDHAGGDTQEYIEFVLPAAPFTLPNYSLINIGDDNTGGSGVIEGVVDLSGITANFEILTLTEDTFDLSNFKPPPSPRSTRHMKPNPEIKVPSNKKLGRALNPFR